MLVQTAQLRLSCAIMALTAANRKMHWKPAPLLTGK